MIRSWHTNSGKYILYIFYLVWITVTIVNFAAISTLPSWFDEAYFANISFNLFQGKGLIATLIPEYSHGEVNVYGPVFFYLQSFLIGLFGLDSFVFRLPTLIFANISILFLALVLRNNGVEKRYQLLFAVAAMFDVSFNRSAIDGRMDIMALMFVSLAMLLTGRRRTHSERRTLAQWLLVGIACAMAYLATPRALFLLPIVLTVGIHRLLLDEKYQHKYRNWLAFMAAGAAFFLPVWIWIQHAGGVGAYVRLFTNDAITASHIATSFLRTPLANVAIILMLILVTLNLKLVFKNVLSLSLLLNYVAFSLFVKEVGPYAGMITPFVIMLIFVLLSESTWTIFVKSIVVLVLVSPGCLHLLLRGADYFMNADCRDRNRVAAITNGVVRDNIKIVAPFKYYFLLAGVGHDVETLEWTDVDRTQILGGAEVLIEGLQKSPSPESLGFRKIGQMGCIVRRVPLFPDTYYGKTIFSESIYRR